VRASDGHPSAAAVYRLVPRRLPRVSLATVDRNLRILAAEGLLTERADLGGMRFDGNTEPHDHFTCVACSRIHDVRAVGAPGSGPAWRPAPDSKSSPIASSSRPLWRVPTRHRASRSARWRRTSRCW
jgi:hypothetical protein